MASSSLVPRNDPTLMFTNAGMVQFKNVFTGVEQRPYQRATPRRNACARAASITTSTMSAIPRATTRSSRCSAIFRSATISSRSRSNSPGTLITKEFGLPKDRLCVTVYHDDDEAFDLWKRVAGLPRIAHHPHCDLRQFLGDGRHRPLRPLFGNLLRPRRPYSRRPARLGRRRRRPLHRDLESRVHAVRDAARRRARQRCRAPRSTPAWGSSASPRCCRASTTITTST